MGIMLAIQTTEVSILLTKHLILQNDDAFLQNDDKFSIMNELVFKNSFTFSTYV